MKRYQATIGGRNHQVELEPQGEDLYRLHLDSKEYLVDARRLSANSFSMLLNNESFDIDYSLDHDLVKVVIRGMEHEVEVLDERRLVQRLARSRLQAEGSRAVIAPMPGRVVKVLVKAGDRVSRGQGVLIVEAMKMENELYSPSDGEVKEIKVNEGQDVEGGVALITIE